TVLARGIHPNAPSAIFGVTGTNGKSSVASFVNQLCQHLGHSSAFIGTTGYEGPMEAAKDLPDVALTSVDPIALHKCLEELARNNVECMSLEASSHGLDQYRLDGLCVRAAGFTNIEIDHLDYHKTFEHYLASKQRLFTHILSSEGTAVLNADVPYYDEMRAAAGVKKCLSYGRSGHDIQLLEISPKDDAQTLLLKIFGKECQVDLPLVGDFQAMNALCALGMVNAVFGRLDACLQGLSQLKAVSGRMQKAGVTPDGGLVYIDYAQNSDGMRTALKAIRPYVKNELTVLFGCGGGRDLSRRQGMGKAAREAADRVIVTDDNPRFESPEDIRAALMSTCPEAIEIPDRKEAIAFALKSLRAGDVCLIAGKGHERFEQVGSQKTPYNDFEEAQRQLKILGGVCS
ncbi:MAG: UDP-N-acetylmuramoyl-L-alanyl-D-glutamate--2,6-diaminopimelate ligase, partial [Alphaproteobacteria bacterium]|nr:UDP-N-acetylmuramoyl-L-alanyl-D-glutamate--2,6-diaminopimelate ligase [Alphaproteobacteria bacterium]